MMNVVPAGLLFTKLTMLEPGVITTDAARTMAEPERIKKITSATVLIVSIQRDAINWVFWGIIADFLIFLLPGRLSAATV